MLQHFLTSYHSLKFLLHSKRRTYYFPFRTWRISVLITSYSHPDPHPPRPKPRISSTWLTKYNQSTNLMYGYWSQCMLTLTTTHPRNIAINPHANSNFISKSKSMEKTDHKIWLLHGILIRNLCPTTIQHEKKRSDLSIRIKVLFDNCRTKIISLRVCLNTFSPMAGTMIRLGSCILLYNLD